MKRLATAALTLLPILLAAGAAHGQESYPFIGRWGGGPTDCTAPFVFTRDSYTPPGDAAMRYRSVRRQGRAYVLSLPRNYRVTVMPMPNGRLSWLSGATGDGFELTRCR
jgi:hypothetical protein